MSSYLSCRLPATRFGSIGCMEPNPTLVVIRYSLLVIVAGPLDR